MRNYLVAQVFTDIFSVLGVNLWNSHPRHPNNGLVVNVLGNSQLPCFQKAG